MAYTPADLVCETSTTTGAGAFSLAGAKTGGYFRFAQRHAVGDTIPYRARKGGDVEVGLGTLQVGNVLSRDQVYASTNNDGLVNFLAGEMEIAEVVNGASLARMARTDSPAVTTVADASTSSVPLIEGGVPKRITIANLLAAIGAGVLDLPVVTSMPNGAWIELTNADGTAVRIAGSSLASSAGTTDTTAPTMVGSLASSSITQTGFTLTWQAATDAVGVTGYEVSTDGGTTYTNVGNVLTKAVTALTASTTYNTRVRAYDAAGNRAVTPLSLAVTTAASADTAAPSMAGSLTTTSVTASGYTMNWSAASDNVAVTGYETSTDGGTTWSDAGNVLTRAITGAAAATTYQLRVRAYDAAGNRATPPLSASVTTTAQAQTYTITPFTAGNTIKTSLARSAATGTFSPQVYFDPGLMMTTTATFWNINPNVAAGTNVRCGWSLSSTTPPPESTLTENSKGTGSINALVPMFDRTDPAWENQCKLWADSTAPSGPWFFHVRVGTEDYCLNAGAGLMVT